MALKIRVNEKMTRKEYVRIESSRDTPIPGECVPGSMTVGEFIQELEGYPSDIKVAISNDNGYTFGKVNGGSIRTSTYNDDDGVPVEYVSLVVSRDAYSVEDVLAGCYTVQELIDELRGYDPDESIVFKTDDYMGYLGYITGSSIDIGYYDYDDGEPEFTVGFTDKDWKSASYKGSNKKTFRTGEEARKFVMGCIEGALSQGIVEATIYDKDDAVVWDIDLVTGKDI